MVPIYKMTLILLLIGALSILLAHQAYYALNIVVSIIMGTSINKTWFIGTLGFVVSSKNEDVLIACGKRLADWLLAFSAAALVSLLFLMLTDGKYIIDEKSIKFSEDVTNLIFTAAFIVMMTLFSSLRITKHLSEGIRRINTRSDLREIISREFGDLKFKYDELPLQQVDQILHEYNVDPPVRAEIKNYLKPILQKHGLIVSEAMEDNDL